MAMRPHRGPIYATFRGFFDRAKVMSRMADAKREALADAGAWIRTVARNSIRRRKRRSFAGEPPTNRTGILKKFLYFAFDFVRNTMVVGPVPTGQVFFDGDGRPVKGTVPGVLEHGGEINVLEVQLRPGGKWFRRDLRATRREGHLPQRFRKCQIAPRPYMAPALEKSASKIPEFFRDSVRAA